MNATTIHVKMQYLAKMTSMISNAVAIMAMVGKDVTHVKLHMIATSVMVSIRYEFGFPRD